MTNWKEKFEHGFWAPLGLLPEDFRLAVIHDMQTFIKTEIIEKLMEKVLKEIGAHHSPHFLENCPPCKVQQLRDKWLN